MIVFVSLGPFAEPCLRDAVEQARRASPASPLVVVQPQQGGLPPGTARRLRVDRYPLEDLSGDARLQAFYAHPDPRATFRDGFWTHTTGRFFALRAFMEREAVDRATHLENDVLLFAPLERFVDGPPFAADAVSTVFESERHAVPGIVHVGSRMALDRLTDFVLDDLTTAPADDMHRLGRFRREHPGLVNDLPTVPSPAAASDGTTASLYSDAAPPVVLPEGRWLFDGARFGQFLGGIHPLNVKTKRRPGPRRRPTIQRPDGLINPSCVDRADRYTYRVAFEGGLAVPAVVAGGRTFPLAVLHLHSKRLREFTSRGLRRPAALSRVGPIAWRA